MVSNRSLLADCVYIIIEAGLTMETSQANMYTHIYIERYEDMRGISFQCGVFWDTYMTNNGKRYCQMMHIDVVRIEGARIYQDNYQNWVCIVPLNVIYLHWVGCTHFIVFNYWPEV